MSLYGPNDFDEWIDQHEDANTLADVREEIGGLKGCHYWIHAAEESPGDPDTYIITPTDDEAVYLHVDTDSLNKAIFAHAHWVDNGGERGTFIRRYASDVLADPENLEYDETVIDSIIQYTVFGEMRYV